MIEAMKQALAALEQWNTPLYKRGTAIKSLRQAIAELESQEIMAWEHLNAYGYAPGGYMMICRGCNKQVIDVDKRASRCKTCAETAYARDTHPPQRTEQNFCPRCGKRTNDIHTCTPPQNIEQDLSEQGRNRSAILGNNIQEMVNSGLPFLTALNTTLKVYDHFTPPQRTEERNFCPRCGKRLGGIDSIHTCTPPPPEQEPVATGMKKLTVTLQDRPIDLELAQYKRMFEAACSALGAVSDALGCDPEEGGAEPLLIAIEELKSHPPQHTWQGLTDEEAQWLYDKCRTPGTLIDMVEAKLKEKNT